MPEAVCFQRREWLTKAELTGLFSLSVCLKTSDDFLILVADSFKIKTPLFNLRMRIPGEYLGPERQLPPEVFPEARMNTSARLREYLRDKVKIVLDGVDQSDGLIAEIIDETTGLVDEATARGHLLTIHGFGLKIDGAEENRTSLGLYFVPVDGGEAVKAEIVAVNEPRTLKIIVSQGGVSGAKYTPKVVTQTSLKHASNILRAYPGIRPGCTGMICRQTITTQAKCSNAK